MSKPEQGRGVSDPPELQAGADLPDELERLRHALAEAQREAASWRERHTREVAEREDLLTVLSHELRTPVTVIVGFSRLLLAGDAGPLNERQQRFLEETARSCRRLEEFVGRVIEDARAGAGEALLRARDASLAATVEGVVSFLKPLLDERRLRVTLELSPDAERARFDPPRVEQVLTNLIGNAIRHSPAGGVLIVASRRCSGTDRPFVEVAVSDRGTGVPPAERMRIFEAGVGSDAGGLGVGLAICRRIVEAHGGEISVVDAPGGGARFVFTLPTMEGQGGGET